MRGPEDHESFTGRTPPLCGGEFAGIDTMTTLRALVILAALFASACGTLRFAPPCNPIALPDVSPGTPPVPWPARCLLGFTVEPD